MKLLTWLQAPAVVAALLFASAPAEAQTFTIAVVPDTQNYSDLAQPQPRGEDTFTQQMRYLVNQRGPKNIAFVTFVGDIIQHGDGQFRLAPLEGQTEQRVMDTRSEWDIATRAISILSQSGLPFGMVPGNHDYDNYSWWSENGGPGASRPLAGSRA